MISLKLGCAMSMCTTHLKMSDLNCDSSTIGMVSGESLLCVSCVSTNWHKIPTQTGNVLCKVQLPLEFRTRGLARAMWTASSKLSFILNHFAAHYYQWTSVNLRRPSRHYKGDIIWPLALYLTRVSSIFREMQTTFGATISLDTLLLPFMGHSATQQHVCIVATYIVHQRDVTSCHRI